jgi:hypothetical protein
MPKSYRAEFFTTADWAKHDFEADSPQQALELARQFYDQNLGELEFRSYDEIEPRTVSSRKRCSASAAHGYCAHSASRLPPIT